jgi:glucokinase
MAEVARLAAQSAGLSLSAIGCVGAGIPGSVEPETGLVHRACNVGMEDCLLGEGLSQRLDGLPVRLENDANAAALGEYAAGAGRGCRSMVLVTLGTGIGGGIILDGTLYAGCNHAGGELGHFVIHRDGLPCACGRRGCFEQYASATALIRETRAMMARQPGSLCWALAQGDPANVNGRTAFDAARQGDPGARAVIDAWLADLADGLTSLVNLLQPELLCLGGGVAEQGDALLAPLQAVLDREDYARGCPTRTRLALARLGNDAGLVGAALLGSFSPVPEKHLR